MSHALVELVLCVCSSVRSFVEQEAVKELEDMDIRVMISIWPFVQSDSVHGPDYNASGPSVNFRSMFDGFKSRCTTPQLWM